MVGSREVQGRVLSPRYNRSNFDNVHISSGNTSTKLLVTDNVFSCFKLPMSPGMIVIKLLHNHNSVK